MPWSLVASAVAVAVAGHQYWPIVVHLLCAFSRNILTKAKDIHLPNESSVYTVISKAAGGREGAAARADARDHVRPAWLPNKCQCPATTGTAEAAALDGFSSRLRGLWLMAYARPPSSGLWLFGQHRADDVRAHNEVRVSRPFDRSSDNVATSASNRLQ